LLDIKLPDMEGTELLTKIHGTLPKMMKIMVTGHASLENAVTSVNLGADAYVMKPVKPPDLRRIVEEKLSIQDKALSMSEDKVAEWVETRLRKLKQEGRPDTEKIEITFTLPKGISWATKKRIFTLWIAAAVVTVLLWQVGNRVFRPGVTQTIIDANTMWEMAHFFFGFGIAAFATVLGCRAILTYALVFTGAFAWEVWEVIGESGGVSWRSYLPSFSLSAWSAHWGTIDNRLDIVFAVLGATIVVLLTFVGIALGVATLRFKRK
jgi:CheY-like chemotaxis protein